MARVLLDKEVQTTDYKFSNVALFRDNYTRGNQRRTTSVKCVHRTSLVHCMIDSWKIHNDLSIHPTAVPPIKHKSSSTTTTCSVKTSLSCHPSNSIIASMHKLLKDEVREQRRHLLAGIDEIFPSTFLQVFNEKELLMLFFNVEQDTQTKVGNDIGISAKSVTYSPT